MIAPRNPGETLSKFQVPSAQVELPGVLYRDMRDCFGPAPDAVYIDMTHVTGRGNELLARCLADKLAKS